MDIFSAEQVDVKSDIQEQARLRAVVNKKNSLLTELQGLKTNQKNIKDMQNKQVFRIQEQLQGLQKEKDEVREEVQMLREEKESVQLEIKDEKLSVMKLLEKLDNKKREIDETVRGLIKKELEIEKKEKGLIARANAFKSKEVLLNDTIEKTESELREAVRASKENTAFQEELEKMRKRVQLDYDWNLDEKKKLDERRAELDEKEILVAKRERKVEDQRLQLKATIDNLKKHGKNR